MKRVAEIIALQEKGFDGSGIPTGDPRRGEDIPLGARILKAVLDFDTLKGRGIPPGKALAVLRKRRGPYDPSVLDALEIVLGVEARYRRREVRVRELKAGMVLDQDVLTEEGRLLLSRGQEISLLLLNRLQAFAGANTIREPIRVFVPL
jgi:hypothetical protein